MSRHSCSLPVPATSYFSLEPYQEEREEEGSVSQLVSITHLAWWTQRADLS